MLVTPYVKHQLAVRRFRKNMIERGYEHINEFGNTLWELHRGFKSTKFNEHKIVAVEIDIDRKSIWFKTEKVTK